MFVVKLITASAVLATLIGVGISAPDRVVRLVGGQEVDNLRQFPHHVYIIPFQSSHRCGGTILNAQWVLTSASCVKNSERLDLNFGKKSENNSRADFFSVSVNREHVFLYPTDYDDIALIKIPLRLVFSETIAPIGISKLPSHALNRRFAVMPGFNEIINVPTTTDYTTTTWWTTTTMSTTTPRTTTGDSTTIWWTTTTMSTTTPRTTTDENTTTWFTSSSSTKSSSSSTTTTTQSTTFNPTWSSSSSTTKMAIANPFNDSVETGSGRHFEEDYYGPGHHPPPHPEVDGLKYGMFSIVDHHVCKRSLGEARFDEYTQLCVEGWGTNPNAPCCSDFGSGLVIGWPAKSELVGIFSMFSPTCTSKMPSIFTYVPKYLPWIESMIHG